MLIAESQTYSGKGQSNYFDRNGGLIDGEWRLDEDISNNMTTFNDMAPSSTRNASRNSRELRDSYKHYFCNEGSVPWQYDIASFTRVLLEEEPMEEFV
jgi:hypothetical protein